MLFSRLINHFLQIGNQKENMFWLVTFQLLSYNYLPGNKKFKKMLHLLSTLIESNIYASQFIFVPLGDCHQIMLKLSFQS